MFFRNMLKVQYGNTADLMSAGGGAVCICDPFLYQNPGSGCGYRWLEGGRRLKNSVFS